MIDIDESLVPLREAPKLLPTRNGKRLHISTLFRWVQRGVDGVKLEVLRIGGTTYTSREALQRFAEARTRPSAREATLPQGPADARRRLERAEARARAHGL